MIEQYVFIVENLTLAIQNLTSVIKLIISGFFDHVTPVILFIPVSIILTHFFDDSDSHRGICEKIRARYCLLKINPLDLWNIDPENKNNDKTKPEKEIDREAQAVLLEDYLRFRLIKLHFGLVTSVVAIGLGLWNMAVIHFFYINCVKHNAVIAFFLALVMLLVFGVQAAYIEQQRGTKRRIDEIDDEKHKNKYFDKGGFSEQCELCIKANNIFLESIETTLSYKTSKKVMNILDKIIRSYLWSNFPIIIWFFLIVARNTFN
ncbi:hypothetical protein [Desulforhopalus singaporensis]|uniref:Uncharacterized protein n=1 Tax=Desulforhopalus singaporensis TaxID=91360 RepID=A0A1H0W1H0_9BACT|nr:hypothetical protein [Desulforhopalus singaporensis]SDP84355.1 hypothetical protein SAMN05660330_04361 [Desulforhopalus singaporensis]SDP84587.1 hypothetical protein SAMN05660330_04373 [Desulforhopalus singaporensis]